MANRAAKHSDAVLLQWSLCRLRVDESTFHAITSISGHSPHHKFASSADPYGEDYKRLQAAVKMTHFCYSGPGAGNGTDLRARWAAVAPSRTWRFCPVLGVRHP